MRFILAALVLLGLASYLANPELFGKKKKFALSGNGQVRIEQRGVKGLEINWDTIGSEFAELVLPAPKNEPSATPEESAVANMAVTALPTDPAQNRSVEATPESSSGLSTYEGQLHAISVALNADQARTEALMKSATETCAETDTPEVLSNYFVKLVSLVAITTQFPEQEQRAYFSTRNAELGATIKLWLFSQPAQARTTAEQIMERWSTDPAGLVACHLAWLETPQ